MGGLLRVGRMLGVETSALRCVLRPTCCSPHLVRAATCPQNPALAPLATVRGGHPRRMHAVREVVARGGIARISTLRLAGVTEHSLRQAVRSASLISVCRGWVARPDYDPMLIAAARRGVVLSCITLAARRGLWVSSADGVHVRSSGIRPRGRSPGCRALEQAALPPRSGGARGFDRECACPHRALSAV